MEQEERLKMAYIAGMIDGDGAIYTKYYKECVTPCVQIALSYEPLIKFCLKNFAGTISKSRKLFRWQLRKKKQCSDFLNSIVEFLVEKKELAFAALNGNSDEVKRLNKITDQQMINHDFSKKNPEEVWAYIAGFIDADGHIAIKKRFRDSEKKKRYYPDYSLEVGCGGTDFRATSFIAQFSKMGSLKMRPHKFCVNEKRLDFRIIKCNEIKTLLKNCFDFLIIKKSNAKVALEYIEGYQAKGGGDCRKISEEQLN